MSDESDFVVGGQERELTDTQKFEQIDWYIKEHYPIANEEDWLARLPDRLVHAAMMQLGTAAGHEMPGTEFTEGVSLTEHELGTLFTPPSPSGKTAVASFGRPPGPATENFFFPLVAAATALSEVTILVPHDVAAARSFADTGWGFGAGCPLVEDAGFDTVILTRPDERYVATPSAYREEIRAVAKLLRG